MATAVSGVSLLVAAWGAARLLSPWLEGWGSGKDLAFGAVVVAVIGLSYALARRLGREPRSLGKTGAACMHPQRALMRHLADLQVAAADIEKSLSFVSVER